MFTAPIWLIIQILESIRARSGSYLVASLQNTLNIMVKINSILCLNEPKISLFTSSLRISWARFATVNFQPTNQQTIIFDEPKVFWNEQNDAGHLICMLCAYLVAINLPAMLICSCCYCYC